MSVVDLEPATRRMAEVLDGITDDQLDRRTPCPDYTLGDLVDHIGSLTLAFTDAARKAPPAPGAGPSGDASRLGDDWRERIPRDLATLAGAWRDPEAWTGMTKAGPFDLPGEVAGVVVADELVIHAWDVARATDQSYGEVDPQLLEVIHGFVRQFAGEGRQGARDGMFGPPVGVPASAPLFDRVLGLAGRDPAWSPR